MSVEQLIVFATLIVSLVLFVWGRWRYDLVALMALLAVTLPGIVPGEEVFAGFGHPAVITVAAILIVSRGLLNAGVVDAISRKLMGVGDSRELQVAVLVGLVIPLSAFMNNVGALALLMPVALRMARRASHSASALLMPLAFGSLLGGLLTLIGTPPNIIIATFRSENGLPPFRMFDFLPVGLGVALAGGAFIVLVGWRLVPQRVKRVTQSELFQIDKYVTEVRISQTSKLVGLTVRDVNRLVRAEVLVIGLVRGEQPQPAPSSLETLEAGDVLIIETTPHDLKNVLNELDLGLVGNKKLEKNALESAEVAVLEAVVMANSVMVGQALSDLDLRWRHGVNLLAVARQGARVRTQLREVRFKVGDVLLLQGPRPLLPDILVALGCVPLGERDIRLGRPRRLFLGLCIFGVALLTASLGWLPVQVAFIAAAVAMILGNFLSLEEAYQSIDWPIIVLLGAMIPLGRALEETGGAHLIADQVLALAGTLPPVATLATVLVATMLLSNVINNAAAAVLMAPIAITVANDLAASHDPFLMAVAIGASSAYMTPIGHQSNTLVMGPGGYHFGDYWRMGIFVQIVTILVTLPLLLHFWPLLP